MARLTVYRCGERYVEPGATVADMIAYEREEVGNTIITLPAYEKNRNAPMRRAAWVCLTREEAGRYEEAPGERYGRYGELFTWETSGDLVAYDGEGGFILVEDA